MFVLSVKACNERSVWTKGWSGVSMFFCSVFAYCHNVCKKLFMYYVTFGFYVVGISMRMKGLGTTLPMAPCRFRCYNYNMEIFVFRLHHCNHSSPCVTWNAFYADYLMSIMNKRKHAICYLIHVCRMCETDSKCNQLIVHTHAHAHVYAD